MTESFRYMTDANMPRSVVLALRTLNRNIMESRQAMPPNAKDQAIARLAAENGYVLISYDRDFINIRSRMLQEQTCGDSHLILLKVPEMQASARLSQVVDEVETLLAEAIAGQRVVDRMEVKRDRVAVIFFM